MKLFLMRHAQAEWGEQLDPTRKLTPTGKKQAKMMGKWLNRQITKPDLVIESNFHRSQATARRVAKRIDAPIIRTGKIDPDISPESAWREIRKISALHSKDKSVIAITHGPLIEKLLAMLIGAPTVSNIHFAHAAVAHFNTIGPVKEAAGEYTYDEVEQKRLVLGSGNNCELCEEAADLGWIDMDDVFEGADGDFDEPPLHPNCECSVEQKTRRVRVYESGFREVMEEEGTGAVFHWMVTPNAVARDEDEQDIVTEAALEIAAAALDMVEAE